MTVNTLKSSLLILGAIACAAWSPGAHAADGSAAAVYLDDEVNQCVADCLERNPASSKDLQECRTKLASCQSLNDAWRVSYAKLVKECGDKFVARETPGDPTKKTSPTTKNIVEPPPPPSPPPPPVKPIVICEGSAKKSTDGSGCVCEDGVPARLMDHREVTGVKVAACVVTIEEFRAFVTETTERFNGVCKTGMIDDAKFPNVPAANRAELTARCEATGDAITEITLWYRDLVNGKHPLNVTSWNALVKMVEGLDKRLKAIEDALKAITEPYCPPIEDDPDATLAERCKAEHDRLEALAKKGHSGPFKGGLEMEAGAMASYNHRAGYGKDTTTIGGVGGITGWVDEQNGMRFRVIAGFGANEDSQRLTIGGEMAYLHAFDADKTVSLVLGPQGTVEPNDAGSEASNLGGKVGLNIRLAPHFFLEPELVMGASKTVPFVNGVRTPSGGDWAFSVQPGLALGGQF